MIKLYSTENCPQCRVLKNILDKAGIKYEVENDINRMLELGIMEIPQLEVEGKRMKMKDALLWVKQQ